jgi:orotidine-5'-phosphate decarboxylase
MILGSVIASPAIAGAEKGKMLFASGGTRLGVVYKVTQDGSAQIILDGKLVTIPATTLSEAAGRLETSLTKNQLI